MTIDTILEWLSNENVLIITGSLLGFISFLLIVRRLTTRSLLKRLKKLEIKYNSIKSIPLQFKLNKAIALAKVSEEISSMAEDTKTIHSKIQEQFKAINQLMADTEDYILIGKLRLGKLGCQDLEGMIQALFQDVNSCDSMLDSILEKETQQRYAITALKDEFRDLKALVSTKTQSLSFSMETIEAEISEIEKAFTTFEEWMFACEFEKAEEKVIEIQSSMEILKAQVNQLPDLITMAKGLLPRLLDDVSFQYSRLKQKGVFLNHLEISKNIEFITQTLKDDLSQLRQGIITKTKDHFEENQKRLQQLLVQMEREDKAFIENQELQQTLKRLVEDNGETYELLTNQAQKVASRYGFTHLLDVLPSLKKSIDRHHETYVKLEKITNDKGIPASTIAISFKECIQDSETMGKELEQIREQLNRATTDEDRAYKQLIKLQLILNETSVKINKHRLPTISDSYQGDLRKSKQFINQIKSSLDKTPMDIEATNQLVKEAIDYIYKLYNNVNNIIGMVDMVEAAIVFGNKYRSSFPVIDSELTRAELSFRNGEYTQALTTALAAVEKIHPHSYEDLIKENARSARL